jgi:hypothetical protein
MSEIKVNDLVMVVRPTPCCGDTDGLGTPFTVRNVIYSDCTCTECQDYSTGMWLVEYEPGNWLGACQVIKIDPPAESTGEQDTRRIKETA